MSTTRYCEAGEHFVGRPLSVDGVLLRDNQVLLIRRGSEPEKGKWALPGGHVDFDETVEQAIARELKEEVGIDTPKLHFVGIFSRPERSEQQTITMAFWCDSWAGEIQAGDDASAFCWYNIGKLPQDLAFDHALLIAEALNAYQVSLDELSDKKQKQA